MKFLVLTVLAIFPAALAYLGLDVSTAVSKNAFYCLRNSSYEDTAVRVWRSNGQPDSNAVQTIKNAEAVFGTVAGMYMFPCYDCGDPTGQVQSLVYNLAAGGLTCQNSGMWIDIEFVGNGTGWSNNPNDNLDFIRALVNELTNQNCYPGFYTTMYDWQQITGGSTEFSQYALWYAHFDNSASFNDFKSFGGWVTPQLKQYRENVQLCGVTFDVNFGL